MSRETYQNIMYLTGLDALGKLAQKLSWDEKKLAAAKAELYKRYQPTIIEI